MSAPDPARPAARLLGFDLARCLALEHSRANVVVVLVHRGVLALLLLPIVRLRAGAVAVVGLLEVHAYDGTAVEILGDLCGAAGIAHDDARPASWALMAALILGGVLASWAWWLLAHGTGLGARMSRSLRYGQLEGVVGALESLVPGGSAPREVPVSRRA
ncbi:hypothetical protein [Brachybacterium huguangmaarense]